MLACSGALVGVGRTRARLMCSTCQALVCWGVVGCAALVSQHTRLVRLMHLGRFRLSSGRREGTDYIMHALTPHSLLLFVNDFAAVQSKLSKGG